jgi:hypothetical protein
VGGGGGGDNTRGPLEQPSREEHHRDDDDGNDDANEGGILPGFVRHVFAPDRSWHRGIRPDGWECFGCWVPGARCQGARCGIDSDVVSCRRMKSCPRCAESLRDEASVCPHCWSRVATIEEGRHLPLRPTIFALVGLICAALVYSA